ncbi:MAG TPA: hypothetical protein VFG84_09750 [Gemmatimonadaceae bacterium]|nr:hypothetical protein [Gemmatimonadaceae bacterium]
MQVPGVYSTWWRMTEACSHRRGDLTAVRLFYVPGANSLSVGGERYDGFWYGAFNAIVLADDDRFSGSLVRHEMLHALLGAGHEGPYFANLCAGIVACVGDCAAEAASLPPPDDSAPELPASELEIQLDLYNPSASFDDGWVAIVISARNPRSAAAWVPLIPVESGSPFASTFGFTARCIEGCNGSFVTSSYYYTEPPRLGISASAVLRDVFDLQFPPGVYAVRGTFNVDTTAAAPLTVRQ